MDVAGFICEQEADTTKSHAAEFEEVGGLSGLGFYLLDVAFTVSMSTKNPQDKLAEYRDLLTELEDIWPSIKSSVKPIVQLLCEESSVSEAKHFWTLLVKLRAK